MQRFIGLDAGAETLKLVELEKVDGTLHQRRCVLVEHGKRPGPLLQELLAGADPATVVCCGRLSRSLELPRVPEKQARAAGFRFLHGDAPATLLSIGSHGASALELRAGGRTLLREGPRCSQGTGNFLRQLVERFELDVAGASALAATAGDAAPLSGRCPVILKTDMTHLANAGHDRARIVAGLFDAVAESAEALLRPRVCPPRVALLGGVSRSPRLRQHLRGFLARHGLQWLEISEDDATFCEALGCAVLAATSSLRSLRSSADAGPRLDPLPPLAAALAGVRRMPAPPLPTPGERPQASLVLGLDVGSTGTKAAAIDSADSALLWHAYTPTSGDPLGAAQSLVGELLASPWEHAAVAAVGVTGSGREVLGPLLARCLGSASLLVENEIAAHAEGALSLDPRVDTIFEIGGQDAKYMRLVGGRVVESALNEACSAGTGSFIEEQGRRLDGRPGVEALGALALSAEAGVSLGQHCSVFMAEAMDEAAAAGIGAPAIVAGLYDSVVQNYLNRVKGNRPVGAVVFCQGMPFASDALAAAVARRTGAQVVVPPHPGTIGALGIARLARRERPLAKALDLGGFLEARVAAREQFVCRSTQGCGGSGNRCRIERLETRLGEARHRVAWGGACALHERGATRACLPADAPDPFREREQLIESLLRSLSTGSGPRVALTDELALKELLPFFATFLAGLGLRLHVQRGGGRAALRRGAEEATVAFCAPMQLHHGVVSELADSGAELLFLPMLISTPAERGAPRSVLCPIVEGAADVLRWSLRARHDGQGPRVLSPVLDLAQGGLNGKACRTALRGLARELGAGRRFQEAFELALAAQQRFDDACARLGEEALAFCDDTGTLPVAVLGRPYTIHNRTLDSNVPAILREQGAIAIPAECLPVPADLAALPGLFWGHGQRLLLAARQVRRRPGLYAIWCSNYACGPDSFLLHLFADTMRGKPWAVVETDGHTGDAGTRTRVEAFLRCAREDLRAGAGAPIGPCLERLEREGPGLLAIRKRGLRLLLPRLGPATEAVAACLRGLGVRAECLPEPDRPALELGRRHTSGKECLPLALTLGSVLQRLRAEPGERFVLMMPTARGPCRFGLYHALDKLTFEELGLGDRVEVWSPRDTGYFEGVPGGIAALVFSAVMAGDLLLAMYHDVAAVEREPGAARRLYDEESERLRACLETAGAGELGIAHALAEVARGRLFGCGPLLREAAGRFAELRLDRPVPTVLVVGEIYVRCDPFGSDLLVERLLERGLRVRLAPVHEWMDYQEHINALVGIPRDAAARLSAWVQSLILERAHRCAAGPLGWPAPTRAAQAVRAAAPYLRHQLEGEPALTLGTPLHEWAQGHIDGVVSVAPLECMANRVAEAQLAHAVERDGMLLHCLQVNGDAIDSEALDAFAQDVLGRFQQRP
jgi:activator of 2-hydroxyglutaryl-CoA dehydratase/predicted nucleotide-binding protein (sugar kinase/HSP70/actin superfamily)